ncbi:hypothetical protein [Mucilaginibacter gilvus]|uniref:Uncharacterized protein n=1 Tax=Mucilaginibacter gilvus TaxID=2305909 RepID=A0A444MR63_9SPHI|nr:hypothetical protein [Mucilaginibacter gilvus]RWY54121.1 hypothetical protein EPL05_08750 [Mucilaginibacter gilvus]
MKHLKLLLAAFGVLALGQTASAQIMYERDFKPVTTKQYTDVEGSAYLYDDWKPGTVKLTNGAVSSDKMQLKYNVVDDVLTFKDNATDKEMAFVQPVYEFSISSLDDFNDKLFVKSYRNGFTGIDGTTVTSFFEVLADGKVRLLKRLTKAILENQAYGSATKTLTFNENVKYYLLTNGKAVPVKNDKKSILAALRDKQAELDVYIKTNKVDFKNDAQLGEFIAYYNTL